MRLTRMACLLVVCWLVACSEKAPDRGDPTDCSYRFHRIETPDFPEARFDHALATDVAKKRIFLFGGRGKHGFLNDLWVFDCAQRNWRQIDTGTGPAPRSGHSLIYQPETDRLILFGGFSSDRFGEVSFFRDLWWYSPAEGWNREFFDVGPSGRAWHASILSNDLMLVYGGFSASPDYYRNDVWTLSLSDFSFKRVATDGGPLMVGRPILLSLGDGDKILVYGRSRFEERASAWLWLLNLDSDLWIPFPGIDPPDSDFDFAGADPAAQSLFAVRAEVDPEYGDSEWIIWVKPTTGPIWTRQEMESGPNTPQGMACTPYPARRNSWFCHGGAFREQIGVKTWLLAPCPEEGCQP